MSIHLNLGGLLINLHTWYVNTILFSSSFRKVCRKVEEKGTTTYNEVADELVQELAAEGEFGSGKEPHYDDKNIRRRVYDALNVLMAIDIISKDRKEIK